VVNAERTVDATVYQLLSVLGAFDAESINLPIDYYDPKVNFELLKDDGMSRAVDRFVPVAIQKIGPQLPNIPRDVIAVTTRNPIADEIKNIGENGVALLDGVGQVTKRSIDFVTGQSGEAKRLASEKAAGQKEYDFAPIVLTAPDWTIPPTIESPGN